MYGTKAHDESNTHHHANISFFISIHFNGVVHHQVHKLIEATKGSNHHTVGIKLDWKKTDSHFNEVDNSDLKHTDTQKTTLITAQAISF